MIGWVLLSRQAVSRAAEALAAADRGVRDEVGFLSLHQVIADRLFPGTSVLHTRARYALFVPWVMQQVAANGAEGDLERRLLQAEGLLAGQLVRGQDEGLDAEGAIGADVWRRKKRPPAQPPSFSYWSALRVWGILARAPDASTPRRIEVLRQLSARRVRRRASDDDPDPSWGVAAPFIELPHAPKDLGKSSEPMTLALAEDERRFLHRQLIGVLRDDQKQSLLAKLAAEKIGGNAEMPWDAAILRLADDRDREVLELARPAAALAAVGRGIYSALVERAWNVDRQGQSRVHEEALAKVCMEFGSVAKTLDVSGLKVLFPQLPKDLTDLLEATQAWLRQEVKPVQVLKDVYATAEWNRKTDRSKLTSKYSGRSRRDEWNPQDHPPPAPLGYRWRNVSRILRDVAG